MKDFTDLEQHGTRLLRLILKLNKKFHKETDVDRQIKLANSIAFITRECLSISKIHLGLGELLDKKIRK